MQTYQEKSEEGLVLWTGLPAGIFAEILPHLEESLDNKTLRLVCKDWKRAVDEFLTWLKPRELKERLIADRFSGVRKLNCCCLVGPDLEQLNNIAALQQLHSLAVQGNYTTNNQSLAVLARLSGLTELRLHDAKALSDSGLEVLSSLSLLEVLSLKGADGIHGSGLNSLQHCSRLQALDVSHCCNLNHTGVAAVAKLTNLTCLNFESCKLLRPGDPAHAVGVLTFEGGQTDVAMRRDALVRLLTNLRGLHKLNVMNCGSLTCEWLAPYLRQMRSIQDLNMSDITSVSYDIGVEALASLTTLEHLNLAGLGPLKGATVALLTKLSRLKSLDLSISQLQDKHVLAITRLGSLTSLTLFKAQRLSDVALKAVGRRMANLRELHLSRCGVSSDGLQTFPLRKSLQSIMLASCDRVSDKMGSTLRQLTKLTAIDIAGNRFVSGNVAATLQTLPSLQKLNLSQCESVIDSTMSPMSGLTGLVHLDLTGDQVGDAGAQALSPLTRLTYLGLGQTDMQEGGLESLIPLRHLRELDLCSTRISDAGLEHLSGMTALQKLHLGFCSQITDQGVSVHLGPLARNHSLALVSLERVFNVTSAARESLPSCYIKGLLPAWWSPHTRARLAVLGYS